MLQWLADSEADYDALVAMEDALAASLLDGNGLVDGHDFGSGEMNIYVHTDEPVETFDQAATLLDAHRQWARVRAAYRLVDGEGYTILWPEMLQEFAVS